MSAHIAIGYGDAPDKVALWCNGVRKHKSGTVAFSVINGGWNGSITLDGTLKVTVTGDLFPGARILWEGTAPFSPDDYNLAIGWIEEQIAGVSA